MYSTARFTLVNSVQKNVQHLVCHRREFVATFGENPVCRHFVERAEQHFGDDVRVQIRAKDAGALAFFKGRTNQREILCKTSRRKLFHKLRRAAQLDLENDCEIAIGAESLEMQCRNLAQLFSWIRNPLDLFPRRVERFLDTAVEDRMENVFLALEVKIDGAIGDTSFARDVGDFRVEITVVGEDSDGGAQNRFTLIADDGTNGG